jgi:glycosyltransferase involved in cell wall biosynthesis
VAKEVVARHHGVPSDGRPVIGTSANLRAWKRIDLLLQACAQIKDLSFAVLIVGDGPDRGRLEGLTDHLCLRPRTIFPGKQEHVADYLNLMDIFVLPSNSEESFGNSVVEAMAMGLPSIIFRDGGGLNEHVKEGRTGFAVQTTDELAERLRQLIANPALRQRLGRAASASVRAKYGLEVMTRRYDALYFSALAKRGSGPNVEFAARVVLDDR